MENQSAPRQNIPTTTISNIWQTPWMEIGRTPAAIGEGWCRCAPHDIDASLFRTVKPTSRVRVIRVSAGQRVMTRSPQRTRRFDPHGSAESRRKARILVRVGKRVLRLNGFHRAVCTCKYTPSGRSIPDSDILREQMNEINNNRHVLAWEL